MKLTKQRRCRRHHRFDCEAKKQLTMKQSDKFSLFHIFFWLRRRRRSLLHTLLTTHQPNISFFTSHVFTLLHKMQKNNHCSKSTKVIVYCIPFMSAKDEDLCELYLPVIVIVFLVFVSIAILIFFCELKSTAVTATVIHTNMHQFNDDATATYWCRFGM